MKRKLLANRFYSSFVKFKEVIEHFVSKRIEKFKDELESLMTEKFQTIYSY